MPFACAEKQKMYQPKLVPFGASDGGWVKGIEPTSFVAVCIDYEHHQRGGLKTFHRNVFTFDLR